MLPLPKVAYATSRVVTTFGQSPTIRNAFHLQSSSSPSSSTKTNSPGSNYFQQNKGSSKPLYNFFDQASGGSKGRFTHGYLGVSRVVTQIQPVIANDTGYANDDYEEAVTAKPVTTLHPRRYRSHSLSYTSQERAQKLSVLSTVQIHARSRHAFSQALTTDDLEPALESAPSSPLLTRRNSTASFTRPDTPPLDVLQPPFPAQTSNILPSSAGQIESVNINAPHPIAVEHESEHFRAFVHARSSGDYEVALRCINNFRAALTANLVTPSVHDFNAGLEALYHTRPRGSTLTDIQDLYNSMIRLDIYPNLRTYTTLILAHCDRDREVVWSLKGMDHQLKSRRNLGLSDSSTSQDKALKDALMRENNFASAASLFRILRTLSGKENLNVDVFFSLLKCSAHYGAIDVAIMVWESIEQHSAKPFAAWYKLMIQTFGRAGEIDGAEDIFSDFKEQSAAGKISNPLRNGDPIHSAVAVWNVMIEAYCRNGKPDMAVGLLEQMLAPRNSSDNNQFILPYPAPSTYTTIIAGFCNAGDYQSAMAWFNTLVAQSSSPGHSFDPTLSPTRPDTLAWRVLLETFSEDQNTLSELNTVWSKCLEFASQDKIPIRPVDRHLVAHTNVQFVKKAVTVNPLLEDRVQHCSQLLAVAQSTIDLKSTPVSYAPKIWEAYIDLGLPLAGLDFALNYLEAFLPKYHQRPVYREQLNTFNRFFCSLDWTKITSGKVALRSALKFEALFGQAIINPNALHLHIMRQYTFARSQFMAVVDLEAVEVQRLCEIAAKLEMIDPQERDDFIGLVPFLEDLIEHGVENFPYLSTLTRDMILKALMYDRSLYQVKALIEELGLTHLMHNLVQLMPAVSTSSPSPPPWTDGSSLEAEPETPLTVPSVTSSDDLPLHTYQNPLYEEVDFSCVPQRPFVDRAVTRNLDQTLVTVSRNPFSLEKTWDVFYRNLSQANKVPSPYTLSRMCQTFGRSKDIPKVKFLYSVAQSLLATMEHDKQMQSEAWFLIEDGMIIAMAQAGEVDAAHVHRRRILQQGGAPSADAYGGLILNVKETTDDTSNAMTLFNESQMLGVVPNHYLYNNIISKLAKARKADAALELFGKMKMSGPMPSSITYGAVLGACARVGDATSAEALFEEMARAPDFKPKIPPFNTMMQLYTTTKPNRDRVLFYYESMLTHNVSPTAYTYKVINTSTVVKR
ncbi:hypothetical protein BDP27DRAFT_448259 [Rhodocollybia butyracea]|uniref:PROP1-like PPR domain-containing protein n=1 Tax=Rhodocollybia butyracea TaxID=206335 RepID=A0A9P5PAU5_9AGAR|nr:hypothetical protein BDP27DRAFT_448259 [Rhodocollybia butyracea]